MSNVYDMEQDSDRKLTASTWIAKLDKGLTITETDALNAWMTNDPNNERELLEMARLWDQMDALARLSQLFPHSVQDRVSPSPRPSRWVAVAAAFVLTTIGVGALIGNLGVPERIPAPGVIADVSVYETAMGGISKLELSDGTQITLNTTSRAEVDFNEHQRVIKLDRGEIHIDVAHDPSRPLIVIVGTRIVQAVGTAFSVKIDESQRIEVLVVNGRVRVGVRAKGSTRTEQLDGEGYEEISDESLLVTQGERVVLDASSENLELLEPEEIEVKLSWRDGNLIFRGESLAAAASEISRYTPVEFVLVDENLKKIRVAGLFKAGDVTGFLASLNANFDIVYEQVDDRTILLSSKKGDFD